jgi:hypothetical protein
VSQVLSLQHQLLLLPRLLLLLWVMLAVAETRLA